VRVPGGRGLGLGGLLLLVVVGMALGIDPLALLGGLSGSTVQLPSGGSGGLDAATPRPGEPVTTPEEEELVDFISFVLDDAQSVWSGFVPGYRNAKLVLFRDAVDSGCGFAQSAMGPFYCPADQKVYIDLAFYEELRRRFGAPGDFAQAYVLAHEIGHHVQHLSGTDAEVRRAQRSNPGRANALSVAMELQADCYAGVWGHATAQRDLLESGDLEEGLAAAAAVGDDRIQSMATGRVSPESFTHGSSQQRMQWFRRGFESGDPNACDSFGGSSDRRPLN
jgi:predicted metalloprotease